MVDYIIDSDEFDTGLCIVSFLTTLFIISCMWIFPTSILSYWLLIILLTVILLCASIIIGVLLIYVLLFLLRNIVNFAIGVLERINNYFGMGGER